MWKCEGADVQTGGRAYMSECPSVRVLNLALVNLFACEGVQERTCEAVQVWTPERLNMFTLEGENIDAGSTVSPPWPSFGLLQQTLWLAALKLPLRLT